MLLKSKQVLRKLARGAIFNQMSRTQLQINRSEQLKALWSTALFQLQQKPQPNWEDDQRLVESFKDYFLEDGKITVFQNSNCLNSDSDA